MNVIQGTAGALDTAIDKGLGEKDLSAYITLLEKVIGVEVRSHNSLSCLRLYHT